MIRRLLRWLFRWLFPSPAAAHHCLGCGNTLAACRCPELDRQPRTTPATPGQVVADFVPASNDAFLQLLRSRPVAGEEFYARLVALIDRAGCTANQRALVTAVIRDAVAERSAKT